MEKKKSKVLNNFSKKIRALDKKKIVFISVTSVMGAAALVTAIVFACSLIPVTRFELSGVVTELQSSLASAERVFDL